MNDVLRLREAGGTRDVPGTVEVVYADEWDDLCEVAARLASALRPFAGRECDCIDDVRECSWCYAAGVLQRYDDPGR